MGLLEFLGLMVCVGIVFAYIAGTLFKIMIDCHEDFYDDI